LKALAVGSATRTAAAPDIPTVAEAGVPGFEYTVWSAALRRRGHGQIHEGRAGALVARCQGNRPRRQGQSV